MICGSRSAGARISTSRKARAPGTVLAEATANQCVVGGLAEIRRGPPVNLRVSSAAWSLAATKQARQSSPGRGRRAAEVVANVRGLAAFVSKQVFQHGEAGRSTETTEEKILTLRTEPNRTPRGAPYWPFPPWPRPFSLFLRVKKTCLLSIGGEDPASVHFVPIS